MEPKSKIMEGAQIMSQKTPEDEGLKGDRVTEEHIFLLDNLVNSRKYKLIQGTDMVSDDFYRQLASKLHVGDTPAEFSRKCYRRLLKIAKGESPPFVSGLEEVKRLWSTVGPVMGIIFPEDFVARAERFLLQYRLDFNLCFPE